jgi:hypothetical protein
MGLPSVARKKGRMAKDTFHAQSVLLLRERVAR